MTEFRPESVRFVRNKVLRVSQTGFARKLGCTPESVRNWEHGRSSPAGAHIDAMYRYCKDAKRAPPQFYKRTSTD